MTNDERRYDLAKATLVALLSQLTYDRCVEMDRSAKAMGKTFEGVMSRNAVSLADAMIAALDAPK